MREKLNLERRGSMLKKFTTKRKFKNDLEELIDKTTKEMLKLDPMTEEYAEYLDYYERLTKIRDTNRKGKVTSETIAGIAGSLVGVGAILYHERLHTITSKAVGFVFRRRV